METCLQPLLEVYPKFPIETEKPPSYVEIYSKSKKDILMVYVQNVQMGSVCSPSNATDGLELTGSPLKLDLSLQAALDGTLLSDEPQMWTKDEILHAPLDIVKARQIAQLYSQGLRKVPAESATPMWILCNPSAENRPLLLTVQSDNQHFARGIVTYENKVHLDEVDVDVLVKDYIKQEGTTEKWVNTFVNCKYVISGASYSSRSADELLNAPQSGLTELNCEWTSRTLQPPIVDSKVYFEQEVIVGHLASPCNVLWKSVCSLYNMNQLLVDMTAAGFSAVNLEQTLIRSNVKGMKRPNPAGRLKELLTMTEMYSYTAKYPKGGFLCITDETTTLQQALADMDARGSSNDFTYRLWDVLRDCGTAEELITLFIQALTFISSGKVRPFIDANNKTFLSKLVLKLSRGHSQASKVLKNLSTSPPQVLSMVAQVGIEKTMWEYTRIMSLVEHSFFVAGIWNNDATSNESIDQINQTIQDMTMSGGDFSLNPFESLSTPADQSIRLECDAACEGETADLHSVEEFAAFKRKGGPERGEEAVKKEVNEVPLITDEIDISPWKYLLMKFAQVHLCLEHLCRAEMCLKIGFTRLKPIASRLMENYVSEKSPIKTVGQLLTDPSQKISMPIANNIVQDRFKKPAFWYRLEVRRKEDAPDVTIKRDSKIVHVFSQASVFPPLVCQTIEPESMNEAAEITITTDELKYHCTKYVFISNKIPNRLLSLLQH